ncbi:PepSY-associated TM helix domain-containing protein [Nitrincola tapanii]|uniref:Peptidase n=1 Tax=Nitrincola tapanii TaxID=1708751 RepID=A0A5A9W406_9GAMM|nr:PepSY-associated TM helix domain-containing protein [Nitrincola tapanii]KAA0875352.1 hypothetical protein E1H14_05005 [Nitrincola tapanii]
MKYLSKTQRWMRPLHIYTSMGMLFVMLFFTLTGLTLNNRHWLPEPDQLYSIESELPLVWSQTQLWQSDPMLAASQVWLWLKDENNISSGEIKFDWNEDEGMLTIDIRRPGSYSLIEVIPEESYLFIEEQSFGWLAILNDLHMGRYSGEIWSVFIDVAAIIMLLFTLTGMWLVLFHPKRRPRTLTLAGMGAAIMFIIYWGILL